MARTTGTGTALRRPIDEGGDGAGGPTSAHVVGAPERSAQRRSSGCDRPAPSIMVAEQRRRSRIARHGATRARTRRLTEPPSGSLARSRRRLARRPRRRVLACRSRRRGTGRSRSAHAELLEITPADGAIVDTAPAQVVLRFSEPVSLTGGSAGVLDDDATTVSTGAQSVDDSVVIALPDGLRRRHVHGDVAGHLRRLPPHQRRVGVPRRRPVGRRRARSSTPAATTSAGASASAPWLLSAVGLRRGPDRRRRVVVDVLLAGRRDDERARRPGRAGVAAGRRPGDGARRRRPRRRAAVPHRQGRRRPRRAARRRLPVERCAVRSARHGGHGRRAARHGRPDGPGPRPAGRRLGRRGDRRSSRSPASPSRATPARSTRSP